MKGRADEAKALGEEAVAVAREYGLDRELAITLQVLAGVRLVSGDVAEAEALYRECIAALRRDPSLFWTARALHMMALVAFRQQQAERGAFLMGASEVVRETVGARFFGYDRAQLEPAIAAGRQTVGDAVFQSAWNAGRATPLTELMEELARPVTRKRPQTPERATPAPVRTPALEMRALGPLEILRDGAALPDSAWRYARPRELLLYLAAHPEGCTRDQIGLVFWPDASTTQVKNNFHVMLHHVRKALGRADLVTFERDRYRINWDVEGGVRFDARTFEEMAKAELRTLKTEKTPQALDEAAARLRDAMSLYRGDFLADAEAGDWHLGMRDRLRRLAVDARIALGDLAAARGAWRDAAESFAQAFRVDELNETAFRRFLTALARSGERGEALRQYERLVETLRSTLGAEPDPETRVLYQRLRKAEPV